MQLTFNKIRGRWYVDLPDWEGAFEDLEMVNGSDSLLEILSQRLNQRSITFDIWISKPDLPCASFTKLEENLDGATYQVNNCLYYNDTAWLFNVTKFVFKGFHPDTIYFRVAGLAISNDEYSSQNPTADLVIPSNMEFKKIKVTAVKMDIKKAVTITIDMKEMVKCQTETAVKKALENKILEAKVFTKEDLPKLKYQHRKEVIEEWKNIRPLIAGMKEIEPDTPKEYDLDRFLKAQESAYPEALEEMRTGHKYSHWIWYIFPQQKGLGHSYNSEYYGLDGIDEARAYLAHPILGARLREISGVLLQHDGKDIHRIMGSSIDALKLETCMRLFNRVSPNDVFDKVLRTFFI